MNNGGIPMFNISPESSEGKIYKQVPINGDYENALICVNKLQERGIDITGNYQDWFKVGCSLASLGESGRELFHKVSTLHPDYDYQEADKQFSIVLKRNRSDIKIATFFDYCKGAGVDLKESLNTSQAIPAQNIIPTTQSNESVYTHSFYDLWNSKDEEIKALVPDLIPAVGLLMLLGEDGIGKTQIARQLLLCISFGIDKFLGQSINARFRRAMFVATEDSKEDYTKAGRKQVHGLSQSENIKPGFPMDFVEATNFDDYKALLAEIERLLSLNQYDVIVIDAFSDLFSLIGGEINSNTHARQLLSPLQALANKYQTLFIILHHASKSAMKNKRERGQILVEKNDCQGASAITQKPRTVLALSNDPATGTNYLHCVKANGLPKKYKETALKMNFNEDSLLHELLDYSPVFETESPKDKGGLMPSEIAKELHDEILKQVFRNEPYQTYAKLQSNIQLVYSTSYKQIGLNKAVQFITYYKMNKMINQEPGNRGRYYVSL